MLVKRILGMSLILSSLAFAESKPDVSFSAEAQFISDMSMHHSDAVKMAKMAQMKSDNQAVKALAHKISVDQTKEISQLKGWKARWYSSFKPETMVQMMDMSKLETAKGKEFNTAFLNMMIQHHQAGVIMSNEALPKLKRKQVKSFAENVVSKQTAEISEMETLKGSL
jgi:uncharacterized protein (DUF305 family)